MATTDVEIANMALSLMGEATITALSNSTAAARAMNLHYIPVRDALLRSHPWNFAQRRISLAPAPVLKLTANTTLSTTVVTTTLGLLVGQSVSGTNIQANTVIAAVNPGVNFTLSLIPVTAAVTGNILTLGQYYTSSPSVTLPAFGWTYAYALPSACLCVTEINGLPVTDVRTDFKIEARTILTNAAVCQLCYTTNAATVADYDPLFVECLALKLAIATVAKITQSNSKAQELTQMLERVSGPLARKRDANEEREPRGLDWMQSDAVRARYASQV